MNDKTSVGVHWSFWLIGAVALVWNVMGVINYFMQMNADVLATYSQSARVIVEGRPAWSTAGFAIGVFGGALGSLLLLLRKSFAYYIFIASLLGVIVTQIHAYGVVASTIGFSPSELAMMVLMPLAVAAFLIWYAKNAERKGWLK